MTLLEFILIFFEEVVHIILKIKQASIRTIILGALVLFISLFIVYLLYLTVIIVLLSAPWYIKLFLVSICISCIFIVVQILINSYNEIK